jgi:hypothetical protein
MWFKRRNQNDSRGEGKDGLLELLKKSGVFDTDFPKIDYGYY